MATYYWVGGTGTWDGSTTTNWSASSGGAGSAGVPTVADNVIFDANSNVGTGTFTVTVAAGAVCNDITASGLDGAMSLAGSAAMTIAGSISLPAANFSAPYTGTATLTAASGPCTITTNGASFPRTVVLNSSALNTWTLGSAWTVATKLTLTKGTLDTSTSNYNLTCSSQIALGAGTKSLVLNNSVVTLDSSTGTSVNLVTNSAGFTITPGTSTVNLTNFYGAQLPNSSTWYDINISTPTSAASYNIGGDFTAVSVTVNNFTITSNYSTRPRGSTVVSLTGNLTINGTLTAFAGTGNYGNRLLLCSSNSGSIRNVVLANAPTLTYVDFRDIAFSGSATFPVTGTSIGNATRNANVSFDAPKTSYWVGASGQNWTSTTGWASTSGGAAADANYPLPQDTCRFDGSSPFAFFTDNTAPVLIGALDCTGNTNGLTIIGWTYPWGYCGDITFSSTTAFSGASSYVSCYSDRTQTFTSAGKNVPILQVSKRDGTFILNDNLSYSTGTIGPGGIFDTNDKNVTAYNATSVVGSPIATSILFKTGTFDQAAGNFVVSPTTSVTMTPGTGKLQFSSSSAAQTFTGGGLTYPTLNLATNFALTVTDANTFTDITNTVSNASIKFTSGTTTTFTSGFHLSGASGNLATIQSTTAGTQASLSLASGSVNVSYVSIKDSNAIGGATWDSLYTNGNLNVSNNTGWNFGALPPPPDGNFFMVF